MPQDIIGGLIFDLIDKRNEEELKKIETIYGEIKKFNNIKSFLNYCLNEQNKFYIIYTFSDLSAPFYDIDNINEKIDVEMESLIKSESNLEISLKNYYSNNALEIKIFKIQSNSVGDIIYLKTFIKYFEQTYKCDNKKYIFSVHILRKFIEIDEKIEKEEKEKNEEKGKKEKKKKN